MSAARNFASLPGHIHYAIGVDGGGTSTRARVVHRSGVVVGEGKAGASGLMQGTPQAWHHIAEAIALAVQGRLQAGWPQPEPANIALGLGLAGANNADWNASCLAANPGYTRLVLESDALVALLGAHQGAPGALVIMGTGAIGLALQANGARTTTGGWGFPCGDEGSGADLGLQAVNFTQRAVDGRHAHTPLTRDVYATLGGTPQAMLAWCGAARRGSLRSPRWRPRSLRMQSTMPRRPRCWRARRKVWSLWPWLWTPPTRCRWPWPAVLRSACCLDCLQP